MDFLFEIGLEEVPARMIAAAQAELQRRIVNLLERERLISGAADAESYSTPRRLAVLVHGVAERQQDLSEEVLGPALKIAFPKGKNADPGPAAVAFAKKSGVEVSALKIVETPKGEYVTATSVKAGKTTSEVLAAELPKELAGIYWAKNMSWRPGKPERFVRPVRWLVALLGDTVVPVEFGGYTAGRVTYGHRVLFGPAPIPVDSPESYLSQLSGSFVMADVELRRHTIRKALDHVCRTVPGTRWREDHSLVDKMTHLTEWPSVIAGTFESGYLELPEEVLVTVMRDHQNYFAVETQAKNPGAPALASETWASQNKLAPNFLAVLNTVANEAGEAVIRHGNERVLRARFNDARFFWEFDQRITLEERVALLENITFQKDLGSYSTKAVRVAQVAERLATLTAERGIAVDQPALQIACRLAKTDLTTELVKEFTELQGEVGGLYAKAQGFPEAVSAAIYDQYRPTSMEDRIPRTVEGQLLAIADKTDTIAGMFSLGMEPTGSKDPFALRRAANGIVKILAEGQVPFTLSDVINSLQAAKDTSIKMSRFFFERRDSFLREQMVIDVDVIRALSCARIRVGDDIKDTVARARALQDARGSADFLAVCAAFKRMKNILKQAQEQGQFDQQSAGKNPNAVPVEQQLWNRSDNVGEAVDNLARLREYSSALHEIAGMRPAIDAFFDAVMIIDPDKSIRMGRLTLIQAMLARFSQIADFSEIVVAA